MKLAFVFLVCFVAVSLQQNVYWRSRAAAPFPYYHGIPSSYAYQPEYPLYPGYYSGRYYNKMPYYYSGHQDPAVESSAYVYPVIGAEEQHGSPSMDSELFGLNFNVNSNNNYNNALPTSSPSTAPTIYTTSTSTVSVNTVVTCYTSTLFAITTACRRKRSLLDSILVGDDEAPHTQYEKSSSLVDELPREGRDYDAADLIESSKQKKTSGISYTNPSEAAIKNFMGRQQPRCAVTSTITSYLLSYSTSTATNTKLAASSALSCLPEGYTLC